MTLRNYHKKTVNERLQEQVETLAARLYAANERNDVLTTANTKLMKERDRALVWYDWEQKASLEYERKWLHASRLATGSVALNVVLVVALAVVLVVL